MIPGMEAFNNGGVVFGVEFFGIRGRASAAMARPVDLVETLWHTVSRR